MEEGSQFASPVFKKRFARRKTTRRPFTFARNFESEETSDKNNSIISQVGDRGVVITSPVQLSKNNEGLTISDIVRQSPVPVLIAHSTPKEKQKEQNSEDEEEDEANSSQLRRSFRSREPSQQFLSRRQYPHGTPQHAKAHHAPDEYYIGSKNTSNIDAEVSFTAEDWHSRGRRKGTLPSSLQSSKRGTRAETGQTRDGRKSEGGRSSTKDWSAKRGSSRKVTPASPKATSGRKGRGQAALDSSRSPLPQGDKGTHRDKAKTAPLSSAKRTRNESALLNSSRSQKSVKKKKTPPSLSKGNKAGSGSTGSGKPKKAAAQRTSSQSPADREEGETVALRSVGKTFSRSGNKSPPWEDRDQTSFQEDSELSESDSRKLRSFSQGSKQKALQQREKENRPFEENKQAESPASVQGKQNKTVESIPSTRKEQRLAPRSSKKDANHSEETSVSPSKRANQLQESTRTVSSSAKRRKPSVADTSVLLNGGGRVAEMKENELENNAYDSSKNKNTSEGHIRRRSGKDGESMKASSALRGKKKISLDGEDGLQALGPSPEKRARSSELQKAETSITQIRSVGQESYPSSRLSYPSSRLSSTRSRRGKSSLLTTPDSESVQKNKRKSVHHLHISSVVSQSDSETGTNDSRTKDRQTSQTVLPDSSLKQAVSKTNKSPRKVVTKKTVKTKTSPRRASKSSVSFWKTSRENNSSSRPKRQQQALSLSQSSLYADYSLGEGEASTSAAVAQKASRKGVCSSGQEERKSDKSDKEDERPKRQRSVVTELGVIVNMLAEAEADIVEEAEMSQACQSVVHKAFTFTKTQLQQTESQLKQISELDYQVNKLKSVCKAMSSDSKEKLQQKFILQKELQSLKNQGIDADMMRIDQWLQDYQHLRQSAS